MLAIPDNCTAIPEEPEGGAGSVNIEFAVVHGPEILPAEPL